MNASGRIVSGRMGVIGTAGRKGDKDRLGGNLYSAAYDYLLETKHDWQMNEVASGGAAYADHMAVIAYLGEVFDELYLFLPAPFKNGKFGSTPELQWNPGRTLNRYHEAFSQTCGIDSLRDISLAIEKGARVVHRPGFHMRNIELAHNVDGILAFTFGSAQEIVSSDFYPDDSEFNSSSKAGLKDGGTFHTWNNTGNRVEVKRHINLTKLHEAIMKPEGNEVSFTGL